MNGWRKIPAGRKPIDPERQQIVFQIRAGRPFKDIAEQFGISLSYVSKIRRLAGIPRRVNPASN